MVFNYNKLRGRIIEKYGKIGVFASVLDMSSTLLSRKLNNIIGFSREDIIQISRLLDIPNTEYGEYFFTEEVQDVRPSC